MIAISNFQLVLIEMVVLLILVLFVVRLTKTEVSLEQLLESNSRSFFTLSGLVLASIFISFLVTYRIITNIFLK